MSYNTVGAVRRTKQASYDHSLTHLTRHLTRHLTLIWGDGRDTVCRFERRSASMCIPSFQGGETDPNPAE